MGFFSDTSEPVSSVFLLTSQDSTGHASNLRKPSEAHFKAWKQGFAHGRDRLQRLLKNGGNGKETSIPSEASPGSVS